MTCELEFTGLESIHILNEVNMLLEYPLDQLFPKYPMLYAHRGCSKLAPENTMAAFNKALELEIPGIELDVHQCKTGEVIVTHDSNLKRVTGYDSLIVDTDFSTIRDLDAGAWFGSSFTGEKIPLFEEVLDLIANKVIIDIEIKHWDKECGQLEQKVVDVLRKRDLLDSIMISSFNPWCLKAVKDYDPEVITALIYTEYEEFPQWLSDGAGRHICHPNLLKPNRYKITEELISEEQTYKGIPLITWTEDDPKEVKRYVDMGMSGVITNTPESMLSMFQEKWA